MDQQLENKIIEKVILSVKQHGSCSIKAAAENCFYIDISLNEQKRLAKQIVKLKPCVTEIKNGEVLVRRNDEYIYSGKSRVKEMDWTKVFITVLAAALGYILFKVFLPNL